MGDKQNMPVVYDVETVEQARSNKQAHRESRMPNCLNTIQLQLFSIVLQILAAQSDAKFWSWYCSDVGRTVVGYYVWKTKRNPKDGDPLRLIVFIFVGEPEHLDWTPHQYIGRQ
jgi:hypothetical protein